MYLGADSYNQYITWYNANAETVNEEEEWSINELANLIRKEYDLCSELKSVKAEKKKAKKYIVDIVNKYFKYAKVEIDDYCVCTFTTLNFTVDELESLKKELSVEDIDVKTTGKGMKIILTW